MQDRLRRFQAEHRGLVNSRQAFDAKRASDPAFSSEIEALYNRFVGTFRRYCGDCWHDAFITLLTLKKMTSKSQFRVLAGTLLHDPVNRDVRYMLTPQRLADFGDDLALRHLANNPRAAEYFEKPLPENLDELIADYRKRHSASTQDAVEAEKPVKRGCSVRRKRTGGTKADSDCLKQADAPVVEGTSETAQETAQAAEDACEEYVEMPSGDR